MKTFLRITLICGLLVAIASVVLGVQFLGALGDFPGVHVTIDGDEVMWPGMDFGDFLGTGLALIITAAVMCVVIPLVLLLGLGLPLLIMGLVLAVGLAALLGVGAVLGSPLILIGFVLWLLLRDKPRKRRPAEPSLGA